MMWFRRGSFSKFRGRGGLQHLGWCSCVIYLAVWWPDARAMARSSSGEPAPCLRTDPIQRAQICCLKKFTPRFVARRMAPSRLSLPFSGTSRTICLSYTGSGSPSVGGALAFV